MAGPLAFLMGPAATAGRAVASRVAPMIPGIVKRNPWKSGFAAGGTGLLGYEMFAPDAEEPQITTGGQGINPRMDLIRGRTPIVDDWTPPNNLQSRLEFLQKEQARSNKALKKVLKDVHHS